MQKTHRELWGTPFPVGGEWDAGLTPPDWSLERRGRWTVRREANRFVVLFHRFTDGMDVVLAVYPPTEAGEREAKTDALARVRAVWEEER